MPTIMSHAIVPIAIAVAAGSGRISPRLALAGAVLAILPDGDVAGFKLGVEYGETWGHRGASHSLAIAALTAAAISAVWKKARSMGAFLFLAFAMASHGLLDMLTSGGLGAALLWPFDDARLFAPITPIRVSPIGMEFFSVRGVETLISELKWIWVPSVIFAAIGVISRRMLRRTS